MGDVSAASLSIEVAYARADAQEIIALRVAPGTTLREAIERSGVLARFPEIDLARQAVGVFGTLRRLDDGVAEGDRVEIYRNLPADPKERRRRQAAQARRR